MGLNEFMNGTYFSDWNRVQGGGARGERGRAKPSNIWGCRQHGYGWCCLEPLESLEPGGNYEVKAKWRIRKLQTSDRTGSLTVLEPLPRPMMSMLYFHGQSTQWTPNLRRCLVTTTLNSRNALLVFMNLKVAVSRTWGSAMTKTDQCRWSLGGLGLDQRSRTLKGTWKHRAGHLKVQQTSGEESSRFFIDSDQMIRRFRRSTQDISNSRLTR